MKLGEKFSRFIMLKPVAASLLFLSARLCRLKGPVPARFLRWYWSNLNRFALHNGLRVTAKTIWGDWIRCDTREFQQKHIAIFGLWEPSTTRYLISKQKSKGTFVDLGANIGYYSILASRIFEKVLSIEASPEIYKQLISNISINNVKNIESHNVFISKGGAPIEFFRGPDHNLGLSSSRRPQNSISEGLIPTANLSDLISINDMNSIRMIKIDVEGAEPEIVDWILSNLPHLHAQLEVIIEFFPFNADSDHENHVMFSRFTGNGFHAFLLQGPYSLDEYIGRKKSALSGQRIHRCPSELADVLFQRAPR